MAYKDSVYTIVIAVMCWPKHTHLGAGMLWSFRWLPLRKCSLRLSLAVQLSGKPHEVSDHTAIITIIQWRLHTETHPGGGGWDVVKCIYANNWYSPLKMQCTAILSDRVNLKNRSCFPCGSLNSNSHGCHMACVLIGLSHKLPSDNYTGSLWMRLGLSTSWWMKTESAQVSGARVRPVTRNTVATWWYSQNLEY